MLNKVTLTNFQNHKHLVVDCGKFTTLTGGSNGGKSAVLRAILALVRNDSAGEYVRHGQKFLKVELEFDDCTVSWKKGDGVNAYTLTKDGQTREFDKVGAGVPDEIAEVLRLGPITLKGSTSDKEYVNFHTQLEAPFVISSTPPKVAKLFGELTSASQLYTAVNEGNKRVRSTNSLKTTRMTDIDGVKEAMQDFVNLDAEVESLEVAKNLIDSITSIESKIETLDSTANKVADSSSTIKSLESGISNITDLAEYELGPLLRTGDKVSRLEELVGAISSLDSKISAWNRTEPSLELAASVELSELSALDLSVASLSSALSDVSKSQSKIDELNKAVEVVSAQINGLESAIDEFLDSLDMCPECGETLSTEKKEALKEGRLAHAGS